MRCRSNKAGGGWVVDRSGGSCEMVGFRSLQASKALRTSADLSATGRVVDARLVLPPGGVKRDTLWYCSGGGGDDVLSRPSLQHTSHRNEPHACAS